jgi:hypothetical protein
MNPHPAIGMLVLIQNVKEKLIKQNRMKYKPGGKKFISITPPPLKRETQFIIDSHCNTVQKNVIYNFLVILLT